MKRWDDYKNLKICVLEKDLMILLDTSLKNWLLPIAICCAMYTCACPLVGILTWKYHQPEVTVDTAHYKVPLFIHLKCKHRPWIWTSYSSFIPFFFIFSVFSASPKCPTDLLDIRECETLASFLAHAPCSPSWQDDAGNPAACTSTTLFHAVLGFFWMELGLPAWCWMLVSSKKSPAGRSPELLTASLSPCMVIGSVETAWAWRHAPNTSQ